MKGIGVLWPGAGTLRQVFSTTNASGQRTLDEAAWEASIQQVLAACETLAGVDGHVAHAESTLLDTLRSRWSAVQ